MIRDSLPEKQHIVDVMQRTVLQIEERIAQTERRQQELQVAIDRLKQDIRRKENARKTVREEIIDMENDMVEAKGMR